MDFINQIKKLKDLTKSPEVRELCESYLNGGIKLDPESFFLQVNEGNSNFSDTMQSHVDAIKNEENEISKRAAQFLMESWDGLKNPKIETSGTFLDNKKDNRLNESLMEKISDLSIKDESARSFMDTQELNNLGVMESIDFLKSKPVYSYPQTKIICEQFKNLVVNRGVKEFLIAESFVSELSKISWDSDVKDVMESIGHKVRRYSREIEVSKVLESIKNSGSPDFYSDLVDSLNHFLVSEGKSTDLLLKNIKKWEFNPIVRNLSNSIRINESKNSSYLDLPRVSQEESRVEPIYAPVLIEEGRTVFPIGGDLFSAGYFGFNRLGKNEISKNVPSSYIKLLNTCNKPNVRINENGAFISLGKSTIRIIEEGTSNSVYLGKSKLKFRDSVDLAKIVGLEVTSNLGMLESSLVDDVITMYENYDNIAELDFAKSIISNIYEGVSMNIIKWEGQIYVQKVNESMREKSLYKATGSQAVKAVKDYLRYDISEGLTEFLEGDYKRKSIMINDRKDILNNINIIESEISKLEKFFDEKPELKSSPELGQAHYSLCKELSVLREKWNHLNIEIDKVEDNLVEIDDDIFEDEKFQIGDFVKVKESGETGKILSVDGSSGRYTVLLDSGRTSDFTVGEISDLEEALSKASEENDESDEDGEEELKEGRKIKKSDLEAQRKMLKNFKDGHSFAHAPGKRERIPFEVKNSTLDIDHNHGYNTTLNEEEFLKKKSDKNFYFAPSFKDQKKTKEKFRVDLGKHMTKAPSGSKREISEDEGEEEDK